MLRCSACGRAVIVLDGHVIRACHCNAVVVGSMTATVRGAGAVKPSGKG